MTIFAIAARPTFTAPVEIAVPGNGDDGAPEIHTVVIEFKRLKRAALNDYLIKMRHDVEALKEIVVGWRRLLDANDQEVKFNDETFAALLDIPQAPQAIFNAFLQYSRDAARKN